MTANDRQEPEVPGLKRLLQACEIEQARAALDALESYALGRGDDEGARSWANCVRKVLAEALSRAQAR
jgi:hypothetical protein